jgi:3-phosphoshikimate 1-carboxyvinyltransferase
MDKSVGPFEVPSGRPARGRVAAPPSKSHAIRALVCAALAEGMSTLHGLSRCDADDVQRTIIALRTLGFAIEGDRVTGAGGRIPHPDVTLDLGGSGTAFRFLTAVAALGPGPTTLTGDESLRRRPMGSIVRPLRQLGVKVRGTGRRALPPLVVSGGPPRKRVKFRVSTDSTSQSLSALMLVGPGLPDPMWPLAIARGRIRADGEKSVSKPYLAMTDAMVRRFGVWTVKPRCKSVVRYRALDLEIEADWSGAAFLLAAGAVAGGNVLVEGLRWETEQADRRIVSVLRAFGAVVEPDADGVRVRGRDRRPLDVDLHDAPDLAPLVGALGCVAEGTTRVRGAAHLRIKESDRIATVVAAARALGCEARELPDGFEIVGPAKHGGLIETQHDHRIAMAFAVAGLWVPGVVIDDPACVAKSYPGFWDDLARLTDG